MGFDIGVVMFEEIVLLIIVEMISIWWYGLCGCDVGNVVVGGVEIDVWMLEFL